MNKAYESNARNSERSWLPIDAAASASNAGLLIAVVLVVFGHVLGGCGDRAGRPSVSKGGDGTDELHDARYTLAYATDVEEIRTAADKLAEEGDGSPLNFEALLAGFRRKTAVGFVEDAAVAWSKRHRGHLEFLRGYTDPLVVPDEDRRRLARLCLRGEHELQTEMQSDLAALHPAWVLSTQSHVSLTHYGEEPFWIYSREEAEALLGRKIDLPPRGPTSIAALQKAIEEGARCCVRWYHGEPPDAGHAYMDWREVALLDPPKTGDEPMRLGEALFVLFLMAARHELYAPPAGVPVSTHYLAFLGRSEIGIASMPCAAKNPEIPKASPREVPERRGSRSEAE